VIFGIRKLDYLGYHAAVAALSARLYSTLLQLVTYRRTAIEPFAALP